MSIPPKLFIDMEDNRFILPKECIKVCQIFYTKLLEKMGLTASQINSYIYQTTKLNQLAQDRMQFRSTVIEAWKAFIIENGCIHLVQIANSAEQLGINDFLTQVLCTPTDYERTYVLDLFKIYERYQQSNKGLAQIETRPNFRSLMIKLAQSKALISFESKYPQLKVPINNVIRRVINIQLAQTYEKPILINEIMMQESSFFEKVRTLLIQPMQGPQEQFLCCCAELVSRACDDNQKVPVPFRLRLELCSSFLDYVDSKDPILFEVLQWKHHKQLPYFVNYLLGQFQENKDWKVFKQIYLQLRNPQFNFKDVFWQLVSSDMYSRENETLMMQVCEELKPRRDNVTVGEYKYKQIHSQLRTSNPMMAQEYELVVSQYRQYIDDVDYDGHRLVFKLKNGNHISYDSHNKYSDGRSNGMTAKEVFIK